VAFARQFSYGRCGGRAGGAGAAAAHGAPAGTALPDAPPFPPGGARRRQPDAADQPGHRVRADAAAHAQRQLVHGVLDGHGAPNARRRAAHHARRRAVRRRQAPGRLRPAARGRTAAAGRRRAARLHSRAGQGRALQPRLRPKLQPRSVFLEPFSCKAFTNRALTQIICG
jgi:hypothetical protein